MPMYFLLLGIQIMKFEPGRRLPGLAALAIVIISSVFMIFSTSYRLKMVSICVWVAGMAFLLGYLLTTLILE